MVHTLEWTDSGVRFIDQTKLPAEETYVTCKTYEQVADAIRTMVVRGAAAIGVAAAMGSVLTHCNAGALATCGYGTALGVIRAAVEQGKKIHVYADETRPFLQGSRLTAWELMKDGIPTTVISDNMAGAMMKQGKIGAIVVGADRIAANGDVANKIGTYTVAVLAKEHGIPFYVAAPISTVDLECPDGSKIPIEQRNAKRIIQQQGGFAMFTLLLWCILFVLCWPVALLALVAYPFIWLLLLPFRILGVAVHGVLEAIYLVITLPFRLLAAPFRI